MENEILESFMQRNYTNMQFLIHKAYIGIQLMMKVYFPNQTVDLLQ